VTLTELFVIAIGLCFGMGAFIWCTRAFKLVRPNFQGKLIPAVAGLTFIFYGNFVYGYEWLALGLHRASAAAYYLVLLCFGLLGFCDDIFGDRSVGGFRGHFKALLRGRLTTGAVKAIGGGFISLAAGFLVGYPNITRMLLAALLIALSANLFNLIDLRPGRCLFFFLVCSFFVIVVLIVEHAMGAGFLFYLAVGFALILYPMDAAGQIMLGDTGSNAFGGLLGLVIALCFNPLWQGVIVVALIAFHIWSEGHSLSQTIEQNPLLRRIDRKIGIR
jgi:UDP-GlcNAc:undecaprenyl-phosphate/decaprenyl-phosphate GlcNAc-1-phosphate transferase